MNIQFDAQSLMDRYRTGISWTAHNIIESLVKTDQQNNYELNYFAINQLAEKRNSVKKLIEIGCRPNECKWFDSSIYKILYNFIPVPYRLFFKGKPDITHFMNYHIPPGVNGKVVTMVYDMVYKAFPETMTSRNRYMLNLSMERSCRRADIIVTISQFSKNEIVKYLRIHPDKIVVMPCGVDLKSFRPDYASEKVQTVREKYGVPNNYFLYLGTLEPRKNIERLIEAYHLLKQNAGNVPKLVIAGRKGWQYQSIFEKVVALHLNDNVIFTGYIDAGDSPVLIKGAMAFVFPSIYEGFGLPPLEAMACGTPVITSNAASLPEVVGDAALLVDPYSIESIASAMERIITDEALRLELSQKGLLRASSYSWEKSAEIILEVYRRLANT